MNEDALFGDPTEWEFQPSEEAVSRIRAAYLEFCEAFGGPPDFAQIRAQIMVGFGGDLQGMLGFWDGDLLSDMPGIEGGSAVLEQVRAQWRVRKVASIVASLGYEPLVAWDRRSLSASLKSPDQLRLAADELDGLDARGYALENHEVDPEGVATWHLRKRAEEAP